MSKLFKILLILAIILSFTFAFYYVQATSNENVINETATSSSSLSNLGTSAVTRVSQVNSYSDANLSLNNILNIILISIGILLILFAIAILIRLKK